MKLKFALFTITGLMAFAAVAQAGPSIRISFGSDGCYQRPVYYSRQPVCRMPVYPAYYAPAVYPAYYYGGPARYSNVQGFVNGSQGIIRVPPPIYPVQPVTVDRGHSFRWR